MARDETGYETLLGAGLVPNVPCARVDTWDQLLAMLFEWDATSYKTLVLDALGGFERLCHEHVCKREFNGDWGEKGFTAYQRGYEVSLTDWLALLKAVDRLRDKGVTTLLLSHCKVETFKNPTGADYDHYVAECHHKTWALTKRWADAILFGTFFTIVETDRGSKPETLRKGKGIGGTERVIYTQHRDGYDAKNRYNMPESIDIPNDPSSIWKTIWTTIQPQTPKGSQ